MKAVHTVDLGEAASRLPQLLEEVASGKEVLLRRPDGQTFQLVQVGKPTPEPRFGSARGLIVMRDDFDEPLKDFRDYME